MTAPKNAEPFLVTRATVSSPCECQAQLFAELDTACLVARGWAVPRRGGSPEGAPAIFLGAGQGEFRIGWHCPFCWRNVLRTVGESALLWSTEIQEPG